MTFAEKMRVLQIVAEDYPDCKVSFLDGDRVQLEDNGALYIGKLVDNDLRFYIMLNSKSILKCKFD